MPGIRALPRTSPFQTRLLSSLMHLFSISTAAMRTMQREKLGQRVVPLCVVFKFSACMCACVHARRPEAAANQRKMAWLARCEKRQKGRENWRKKREETVGRTGSWQTRRLTARDPGHSPRFYKQPNTRTSDLLRFLHLGYTFLRFFSLSRINLFEKSLNTSNIEEYIPIYRGQVCSSIFDLVARVFPVCNLRLNVLSLVGSIFRFSLVCFFLPSTSLH